MSVSVNSYYTVSTVAELKALAGRPSVVQVLAGNGVYNWTEGNTTTGDDVTVIEPTAPTPAGRYILSVTDYPLTVENLAAIKALTSRPESVLAKTGQAAGTWQWVSGSSTTADDALVVQCTAGAAGRYKRVYNGTIQLSWFNSVGDGTTNDRAAFVAADAAGDNTYVPAGAYAIASNVTIANRLEFEQGATLKPANGVTVTLSGPINAGLWQIFDLSAGGSVVLSAVPWIEARWFGAHPSASATTNSTAINEAITCAKASQNADLVLGPGTLEINTTLSYSNSNEGITTIGTIEGSLSQGSTPGITVLKWIGGASPMINVGVGSSYHTFTGFNLLNVGNGSAVATHGIKFDACGRQWVDRVTFSGANGGSAFTTASIALLNGVNYDRITRCEFETGCAVLVGAGNGATLLISEFMMDSTLGSGAFIDIRGSLDVLNIREGTCNYQMAMRTFIDMSNIGSYRVAVTRVTGTEFDGNTIAAQLFIAKVQNCDAFLFEANQASSFGNPLNTESPITATDSRVTLRNLAGLVSINQPLVRTLDTTSFVYAYESLCTVANTNGLIEANSQSGNLITVPIVLSTEIVVQGDRASAMAHSVHVATLVDPSTVVGTYNVDIARVTDSSDKGFMTKGQVFTLVFYNNSGAELGVLHFNGPRFTIETPLPAPPPNGKRLAMTFVWDGATARELFRQYDANPTWVSKTATAILKFGERRIAADATGGNITITLPSAVTAESGARVLIKKINAANTVTVDSAAGTIDGASSYALSAQWSVATFESDGTQWYVVST